MTRHKPSEPLTPASAPAVIKLPAADAMILPPWHGAHDEQIQAMIVKHVAEVNAQRQVTEDRRSVRRNRNRAFTLIGALVLSFMITFTLNGGYLGQAGKTFGPYSFCITILLDSVFTVYAYLRRY